MSTDTHTPVPRVTHSQVLAVEAVADILRREKVLTEAWRVPSCAGLLASPGPVGQTTDEPPIELHTVEPDLPRLLSEARGRRDIRGACQRAARPTTWSEKPLDTSVAAATGHPRDRP